LVTGVFMTAQEKGSPLGSWRNPPLVYVAAELSIAPHYGLGNKIANLQGALRPSYPRTIESTQIPLSAAFSAATGLVAPNSAPTSQPVWQLFSPENTHGVNVNYRAIGLHATAYSDSIDFLGRWQQVLAAIADADLDIFVERAGLRYVDLIVPNDTRSPENYLVSNMIGPALPNDSKVQHKVWATAYVVDGITVQAHTAAPAPPGLLLPPTLNAMPLNMPPVLAEAQSRVASGKSIGWIDTDAAREVKSAFNVDSIGSDYRQLHGLVSSVFRSFMSEVAKEEWE
jgi:uncharacterized protein (TIGR04255 family)